MGNKILIYDNGQRYEIDADLIYVPWFVSGRRSGKTQMAIEISKQMIEKLKEENKNDTVSIPNIGQG